MANVYLRSKTDKFLHSPTFLVTLRGSPSTQLNGFDMLHLSFVGSAEISLRRPMPPLSTMTVSPSLILPKLTTILLRVIFTDPIFVAYRKYFDLRPYRGLSSHRLHDQFTSPEQTLHSSHFRSDVMACDGPACVFTWTRGETCDAAHLLAKSKGDEVYISRHYSIPLPC